MNNQKLNPSIKDYVNVLFGGVLKNKLRVAFCVAGAVVGAYAGESITPSGVLLTSTISLGVAYMGFICHSMVDDIVNNVIKESVIEKTSTTKDYVGSISHILKLDK